ncbi:unnamed protein product [Moneuplotes crassus]|uniref:Uncharacterized protein n=1 Tax=Euplotes crassus TaxID=5936 RepID=A0AAD1XRK9_EUPCR|nr:unnamed protein product [Moneuplotes crassus]
MLTMIKNLKNQICGFTQKPKLALNCMIWFFLTQILQPKTLLC